MTESIVQEVEDGAEAFFNQVKTDLTAAWGDITQFAVTDIQAIWSMVVTLFRALTPALWAQLQPLIVEALTDVADGDYADIETAVLEKAEAAGLDFVKTLGSDVLVGAIALVKASLPAA